jgi:phosphopentomutase
VPVLATGPGVPAGPLGARRTMADIGQTLAAHFGLPAMDHGIRFLN